MKISNMRNSFSLLWIFVTVMFLTVGCQDMTSNQSSNSGSGSGPSAPSIQDPSGMFNNNNVWPPNNGQSVNLAKNLLAKNYYVVLDGSGSMDSRGCSGNDTKADAAKKALAEFVKVIPAEDNLGLLVFDNSGITERIRLGLNNRKAFLIAVNEAGANSGTPLKTAVSRGCQALEAQARRQLGYGEYHIVIVTDGDAGVGENPKKIVTYMVNKTPIIVHTIGFCIDKNHSLNQPGRTIYKTADNPQELVTGLKSVLAESEDFDVSAFK